MIAHASRLSLLALALMATGCLVNKVKVPDDQDGSATGNTGMDASAEAAVNGGEAGATTGEDSGSTTGEDSGATTNTTTGAQNEAGIDGGGDLTCASDCNTPEKSRCDGKTGMCAACSNSSQCSDFFATKVCKAGTGCVQCTNDSGGATACKGDTPFCSNDNAPANECVQCNSPADCGDDKPVCDGHVCKKCNGFSEACLNRDSGNSVCEANSGACVECGPGNRDACGTKVCDVLNHVCSNKGAASADLCQTCLSDAQCKTGQLCVHMFWDEDKLVENGKELDVGWFCQWQKGGGGGAPVACNSSARPYVGEQLATPSMDDPAGAFPICTLSAATCPAIAEQYNKFCGRFGSGAGSLIVEDRFDSDIPSAPVAKELITPDDSLCGVSGKCVAQNADDGAYRCSVACRNTDNDCPDLPVTCGGAPPGTANVCGI